MQLQSYGINRQRLTPLPGSIRKFAIQQWLERHVWAEAGQLFCELVLPGKRVIVSNGRTSPAQWAMAIIVCFILPVYSFRANVPLR